MIYCQLQHPSPVVVLDACAWLNFVGTPRPAHAISPPEVAAFVNTAPQGIVLAAFGTVYGTTLRPEDMHELAKGFAALAPVRVLWALRPAALRSGIELSELPIGSNTMVVPWVDYNVSALQAWQGGGADWTSR
jgi:hypothetical protein